MKVKNIEHLKKMIEEGTHDFFIQLNLGLRSSKTIDYNPQTDKFNIINEIDGTKQRLNSRNIFNKRYTNIGYAIKMGSFFSY